MDMNWILPYLFLSGLLVCAMGTDFRARRIPNALILTGLLAAFGSHFFLPAGSGLFMPDAGSLGFWQVAIGMLCGGAILFPLWTLGVLGAGDVKLMAVLGAFLGPSQVAGAILLTAVAGGVLALLAMIVSGTGRVVCSNLRAMLMNLMPGGVGGLNLGEMPSTGRLPYALAISCGCIGQILLARSGGWPFI